MVKLMLSRKKRRVLEELAENAACGPGVYGGGVVRGPKQQLWGAVPERDHFWRHGPVWRAKVPSQPKIGDF